MSTKKSQWSKHLQARLWTLRIIDFVILFVPLIVYFFIGIVDEGTVVVRKVGLIGSTATALILTIANIVFKKRYRSPIWLMVIGIYIAVRNIMPLISCIAIATIIDEFAITPAIDRIHTKYLASITIDEREQG